VRLFSHGQVFEWSEVFLTHDSISGVPTGHATCGKRCPRQALARADIDSTDIDHVDVVPTVLLGLGIVGACVLEAELERATCGKYGEDC
jgi:hypothetical protein